MSSFLKAESKLLIVKICNFITMRCYFGFKKFIISDWLAISFFLYISTDFIPNSIIFLSNTSTSSTTKYIHLVCKSFCFRKHYMQWLKFMIIIQVTDKVFKPI